MEHCKSEFIRSKTTFEDFLNKEDIDYYQKLKKTLSSHICRNCRNKRVESFNKMLITIYHFINRKKEDNWKRSLICGVCWYKNYICVNIRQMSCLLEKCKSSINGSLKRLFLVVLPNKQQSMKILIEAIPYLKNHQEILHMWSVRQHAQIPQMQVQFNSVSQIPMTNSFQVQFIPKSNISNEKLVYQTSIFKPKEINDFKINEENKIESKYSQNNNNTNANSNDPFSFLDDFNFVDGMFD